MSFAFWKKREVAESVPAPTTAPEPATNGQAPQAGPSHSVDFAGLRPAHDEPTTIQPKRRLTVDALKDRVRRYNCDLESESETFRAAVLLLAAYEAGHNVELLSRRTGYARPFVSKCARRLIDNGVWSAGQTMAEWSPDDEASGAFWNDVGVALGKLCRRTDEDGTIEWAPPGYWNKRYDFVTPDDAPVSTTYHNATEPVENSDLENDANADASEVDERRVERSSNGKDPQPASERDASHDSASSATTVENGVQSTPTEPGGDRADPTPALTPAAADDPGNLFPDAVWLG